MILRNFTGEHDKLWCFTKKDPKTRLDSPRNAFVRKHLYSGYHDDGTRDPSLEQFLSTEIEAPVAPIIRKAIDAGRSGSEFQVTEAEKQAWLRFMQIQHDRARIMSDVFKSDRYSSFLVEVCEKTGHGPSPQTQHLLSNDDTRKRFAQELWTSSIKDDDQDIMDILKRKEIGVAAIKNQKKSFIIGDRPAVRLPNQHKSLELGDPGVLEMYPVAYDVAVYWGCMLGVPCRMDISDNEFIRSINIRVLGQSTAIAGRSEALIRSLSRSRAARADPLHRYLSEIEAISERLPGKVP